MLPNCKRCFKETKVETFSYNSAKFSFNLTFSGWNLFKRSTNCNWKVLFKPKLLISQAAVLTLSFIHIGQIVLYIWLLKQQKVNYLMLLEFGKQLILIIITGRLLQCCEKRLSKTSISSENRAFQDCDAKGVLQFFDVLMFSH